MGTQFLILRRGRHYVTATSFNVVKRAFKGLYPVVSVLTIEDHLESVLSWKPGSVMVVTREEFEEVLGAHVNKDQCIGAVFDIAPRPLSLDVDSPVLVLDDVRSADNVGVICRSAFSLGVSTLLVTETTAKAINMRSARVSMGSLFHLDVR